MNDTHGQQGEGWVGFDLDGTLAKYDGWKGIDDIGAPVGPMVERMKKLHADGVKVKVLTARVAPRPEPETKPNPYLENHWCVESPDDMPWALRTGTWTALEFVQDWCWRHLGFVPEITHEKDHLMLDLYDDRCHQVVPNTGEVVEEQRDELAKLVAETPVKVVAKEVHVVPVTNVVDVRWWTRALYLLAGVGLGMIAFGFLDGWLYATSVGEKERHLHEALHEYMEERVHERVHSAVGQAFDAVAP